MPSDNVLLVVGTVVVLGLVFIPLIILELVWLNRIINGSRNGVPAFVRAMYERRLMVKGSYRNYKSFTGFHWSGIHSGSFIAKLPFVTEKTVLPFVEIWAIYVSYRLLRYPPMLMLLFLPFTIKWIYDLLMYIIPSLHSMANGKRIN